MKSTTKLFGGLALATSLSLSAATAGDYVVEKGPVVEIEEPAPLFYGSVAFGYESTYLFRGVDFGDDAPWAGLDLNTDLSDTLSLNAGVWYINPTQNPADSDELDLYAFVTKTFGDLSVSVGGTYFYFAEADSDASEIGTSIGYSLGFIDLGAAYYYDFEAEGHYYEASISKGFDLTDTIALGLAAGVGFGEEYYGVSGHNHTFVTAGLTFALTETMALDLYVGGNFVGSDLSDQGEDDDVHGGASVSVSF